MVVLRVEPAETVHHTHRGDCYLRIGDESRKLTAAQEHELVYDRGSAQYDASPTTLGVDDLDLLSSPAIARNPRIARVCADLGIIRELGEGIRRLFSEMRQRGLADPIYEQMSSSVKLTLLAVDALPVEVTTRLPPSARAILTVLRLHHRPMGTGELAELASVTRMPATRALAAPEEGIVTWRGNSKRDPRATWVLSQPVTEWILLLLDDPDASLESPPRRLLSLLPELGVPRPCSGPGYATRPVQI